MYISVSRSSCSLNMIVVLSVVEEEIDLQCRICEFCMFSEELDLLDGLDVRFVIVELGLCNVGGY